MVPGDLPQVVAMFERLQQANAGSFPRTRLVEEIFGPGRQGLEAWLQRGSDDQHLLLVDDLTPEVIGHLAIQELSLDMSPGEGSYWEPAFTRQPLFAQQQYRGRQLELTDLAVIKRFGIDPSHQGAGAGRFLLSEALRAISQDLDKVPALVILSDLVAAQKLYLTTGALCLGHVTEQNGAEITSYLFPQD